MNPTALGKRIRTQRASLGITQEQLAEKINVSSTYIGFIERGERKATLDKLILIAEALHVSIDFLLQDSLPLDDSLRARRMQQIWSLATPQQQELIINLANTILNSSEES